MGFGKFQKYKRGLRKMIMSFKDQPLLIKPAELRPPAINDDLKTRLQNLAARVKVKRQLY
jgi:hypothetical protein